MLYRTIFWFASLDSPFISVSIDMYVGSYDLKKASQDGCQAFRKFQFANILLANRHGSAQAISKRFPCVAVGVALS